MPKLLILGLWLLYIPLVSGQVSDTQISPQEIKELILEGRKEKDFAKLGLAYYYRAKNNIGPGIKTSDLIDDFNQSAIYFKFVKDTFSFHQAKLGIAEVHILNESFLDQASTIIKEVLMFAQKTKNKNLEALCYVKMSEISENQMEFSAALNHIEKAIAINKIIDNKDLEIDNKITVCKLLLNQGKVEQAQNLLNQMTTQKEMSSERLAEIYFLNGLSDEAIGNYTKALNHFEMSNELTIDGSKLKANALGKLSYIYQLKGDLKQALEYNNQYIIINDKINNIQNQEMLQRLVTSYENKDQERKIEKLESEQSFKQNQIKQQKRLLYTLAAAMLAGFIAIFYIIRFYTDKIKINQEMNRQREHIQNQEIHALENQVKINNLESMVHGQEIERNRIAQDLHDSLGGMLSAVKLHFDALHNNPSKVAISESSINHVHNLIDEACEEVREVARNLKPTSLENMGLEAAIRDLVNRFQNQDITSISFFSDTQDKEISFEAKLHLYRIVQELINNALKHAQATEIDIQLYSQDDQLSLSIEDDGVGFEKNLVKKGLGLNNIYSRLAILNGDMEIDSSSGNGSSFFIKIPLQ